jgi:serine/threonine protein kinase
MPALEQEIIDDLTKRLERYLLPQGGASRPDFINAGGSAAVYRVSINGVSRAVKAFNPQLFEGVVGDASRKRLDVQRRLINHDCPSLVQTYAVDESEGTVFIQMEDIEWPQLKDVLAGCPDDSIVPLLTQLVEAVRYLECKGVVHRDIKPENIHVSPDFSKLKLLDLGVARDFDTASTEDSGATDQPGQRPFLATAQYSSPEYLFRLDEPTTKLWSALNIYQIGAVLHDLIMKRPLFHEEMLLANRWLVAKAVLTKIPSFKEANPTRLVGLKALAAKCLVKDMDLRLQLIGWDDFAFKNESDPMNALRKRLNVGAPVSHEVRGKSADQRLEFLRSEFNDRVLSSIRSELTSVCATKLPFRLMGADSPNSYRLCFPLGEGAEILVDLVLNWQDGVHSEHVTFALKAILAITGLNAAQTCRAALRNVAAGSIAGGEEEVVTCICAAIAEILSSGLDVVDNQGLSVDVPSVDLQIDKSYL